MHATDARLTAAGEFWEDINKYRSLINRLGIQRHVTLINQYIPSEDVHRYFDASDVVVLPYVRCTGSGIAQIALGCGRPVIASAVGSLCEIIEDGKNGLLVPPADSDALARTIVEFHRKPIVVSATDGSRFSWDNLTHQLGSLTVQ